VIISKYIGVSQKIWIQGIQTRVDVTASALGSMKVTKDHSEAAKRVLTESLGCKDPWLYAQTNTNSAEPPSEGVKTIFSFQALAMCERLLLYVHLLYQTTVLMFLVANNMRVLAPLVTVVFFVLVERSSGRILTSATAFTALSLIGTLSNSRQYFDKDNTKA